MTVVLVRQRFARTLARRLPAAIGAVVFSAGPGAALADAYRVPYQGAAAAGQGEAFSAQADDPSAIYYNPAGLTQLKGWQVYTGTNLVGGTVAFENARGQQIEGDLGGSVAVPPPSNLYLTANLKDLGIDAFGPLSVGVGLTGTYGLIVRYPKNGPFSSVVTSAKLPLLTIKPTIAYRVHDWVSFGLGLDIYTFASFLGEGHYESKRALPGIGGDEVNGNGTGVGYNASLMVTPLRTAAGKPQFNIGFVYRGQTTLPLSGQYRLNGVQVANAKTELPLPQVVTGAVAYWPVRDAEHEWKLEYDMDFVGWDSSRSFDVHLSNGGTASTPQHWRSIFTASAGTEFRWLAPDFLPGWEVALRTGYQRSNTPVPEYTFTPTVADADWNIFAVGVGLLCNGNGSLFGLAGCGRGEGGGPGAVGIDLAFQAAFFEPRTIAVNRQPSVIGRYDTTLYIGSVNFRVAF
ncbi:OmpP1/FadL family transporter [Methylotetracoccus oryzae]|uniref:OmpP1/FadL family transporter n=1 Tax=Methylotetracoccus oryzae TaxID=1919059 RepID=UPI0013A534C9|nr:outer membrane protein transport protein [Methylotetracoccus oryzae]